MRYRGLKRRSGLYGQRRRMPLLSYGRYSRFGRYGRIYSEAEAEEVAQAYVDFFKETVELIEEEEKKDPKGFEKQVEQLEEELKGKVNSRTFARMARLKIYNKTVKEFVKENKETVQLFEEAAELLTSGKKTKSGFFETIKSGLRFVKSKLGDFRNFILRATAAVFKNRGVHLGIFSSIFASGVGVATYVHFLLDQLSKAGTQPVIGEDVILGFILIVTLILMVGIPQIMEFLGEKAEQKLEQLEAAKKEAKPYLESIKRGERVNTNEIRVIIERYQDVFEEVDEALQEAQKQAA